MRLCPSGHKPSYKKNMSVEVLLCCGAGMSSGFLATATEKAAMAEGLDWDVTAKSQSVAMDEMPDYDILLLGPHFKAALPEFEEAAQDMGCKCKIAVIPQEIYGNVDGKAMVKFAKDILSKK
jgi:PTS system cellobiose-specific IIB component